MDKLPFDNWLIELQGNSCGYALFKSDSLKIFPAKNEPTIREKGQGREGQGAPHRLCHFLKSRSERRCSGGNDAPVCQGHWPGGRCTFATSVSFFHHLRYSFSSSLLASFASASSSEEYPAPFTIMRSFFSSGFSFEDWLVSK